MRRYAIHIDSFSGALADLPTKLHGDQPAVLTVLREHPVFSVWDATASQRLARTLDSLSRQGRIRHTQDEAPVLTFPWCRVEVLDPTSPPSPTHQEPSDEQ